MKEELKKNYLAKEVLEARLEKYSEEKKANIKIVAETAHYILTAAKREEEGINIINLSITKGRTYDRMLPDVFIDQDYEGKCLKAEINWGAYGDCTAEETQDFINYLQEAVCFVKQINGKDFSEVFNN